MSTWLRLTLITMTIGGGFTGIAITSQMLLSPQLSGPALTIICIVFLLLYLFVLISGLLFVQSPQRILPLVIALGLQIPVIFSPIATFRFAAGLHGTVGFGEAGPFCLFRLGSEWQFNLFRPLPWGFGINLVAVVLLAALSWSVARRGHLESAKQSDTNAVT